MNRRTALKLFAAALIPGTVPAEAAAKPRRMRILRGSCRTGKTMSIPIELRRALAESPTLLVAPHHLRDKPRANLLQFWLNTVTREE
jgi:hypothetical protein